MRVLFSFDVPYQHCTIRSCTSPVPALRLFSASDRAVEVCRALPQQEYAKSRKKPHHRSKKDATHTVRAGRRKSDRFSLYCMRHLRRAAPYDRKRPFHCLRSTLFQYCNRERSRARTHCTRYPRGGGSGATTTPFWEFAGEPRRWRSYGVTRRRGFKWSLALSAQSTTDTCLSYFGMLQLCQACDVECFSSGRVRKSQQLASYRLRRVLRQ